MNILRLTTRPSIIRNTRLFVRNFYFRKVKKGCECPEPPADQIVQEKSCTPCSFLTWKPKPRKMIECEIKEAMKPKQPMRCYAGMVIRKPPPECNSGDIDPFKKNCCVKEKAPQPMEPPPVKPGKPLPYADWDSNC